MAQTADPTAQRPLLRAGRFGNHGWSRHYGRARRDAAGRPRRRFAPLEVRLRRFDVLREKRRPMLGICYGMQFINARLGGTLFADVQAQLGVGAHSPKRTQGVDAHARNFCRDRIAACRFGGALSVLANSFHLQAVENVGRTGVNAARTTALSRG